MPECVCVCVSSEVCWLLSYITSLSNRLYKIGVGRLNPQSCNHQDNSGLTYLLPLVNVYFPDLAYQE